MSKSYLRTAILGLGVFATFVIAAKDTPETGDVDQRTYKYDILREGVTVGSHQVQVWYGNDYTRVECSSIIEVGLLGLTFYRFRYESTEEWDDRGLRRLQVRVDDDGQRADIDGSRVGNLFKWTKNDTDPISHEMPVYPTNHWNSNVVSQTQVLNTLTGSMNRVSIQSHEEEVPVSDENLGDVKAFRYQGDLRLDTWYDSSGRWMGMRFKGRDGSTIEYRCRNCNTWKSL